jgi:branched-chain amino acid transport system ATP-binding protein
MFMLDIAGISAGYGDLRVLFDVSLHVAKGEVVSLVGSNGAGKTTLLRIISGFVPVTGGTVVFKGGDLLTRKTHERAGLGIAHIPQGRGILGTLSVEENLIMGAFEKSKRANVARNMAEGYRLFPILEERKRQKAGSLSGGQQQMLAIARALMMEPDLLMLDEPSLGLAPIVVEEMFKIIAKVAALGMSVLIVEQNLMQALGIATRGYVLETGRILLYYKEITFGSSGAYITYRGESFLNLTFENDTPFYYISLIILVLCLLFTKRFEKSKLGYYLGAIKGDEDAAISLGIPAFKIKLKAFQLSAMLTAAIGVIFAFFLSYIDPTSVCSMDLSVKIGVVVIVGGIGHMWGPVIGSFIIIPLIEVTGILLGQRGGSQILYGLALILIVTNRQEGVISFFKKAEAK